MREKTAKEMMTEWFERVWNKGDLAAMEELMCPECEIKGLDLPVRGPEGFLHFYSLYRDSFDDLKMEITDIIEEGDRAFAHMMFSGRHKATGKQVSARFSSSLKCRDGKVVEAENVVDFLPMLTQLEFIDGPGAMGRVFGGG